MTIEPANPADHQTLTEITRQSKAYWGYTEEQLLVWSDVLTITENYIESNHVFKLIIDDEIAGYYSYVFDEDDAVTLDNVFVLPVHISKGFGKLLMDDFLARMRKDGVKKIILEADPNAEKFYARFGFERTALLKTSVKNRFLPVMELKL